MDDFDCFDGYDPYDTFTDNWGPVDDGVYDPWDDYDYDDMTNFGHGIDDY